MKTTLIVSLVAFSFNLQQDYRLVREWGELIHNSRLEIPTDLPEPMIYQYTFIHTACKCSISRAIETSVKKNRNITTWAFDLSEFDQIKILVDKPKDDAFKKVAEDVWYIEIGTAEILLQDTGFKSLQTESTHLGFYVKGLGPRDRMIEATKRAIFACGGKIQEVSILIE